MKSGINKTGSQQKRNKAGTANRDVGVFAFFLLLSFGLWYVNSLGREMEADIRYDASLVNPPRDRMLTNMNPVKLSFSLKGPGYSVLKLKVSGDRPPVVIDLAKVNYRRDAKTQEYYLLTSGLLKSLTVQIRTGCEIIAIKPDTLFFTMSKTGARPLPQSK